MEDMLQHATDGPGAQIQEPSEQVQGPQPMDLTEEDLREQRSEVNWAEEEEERLRRVDEVALNTTTYPVLYDTCWFTL
ncbi:hypothetical protein EYF80_066498 [Liparis tanakae]|uniref:Uncharacterized protein n=1 Tax=Liparis tanakae TaxID=230148 RepID=A0A4Z2E3V6_9TELE|nr:hypothetical protein EYF80_066498 [Liparis tanakae]